MVAMWSLVGSALWTDCVRLCLAGTSNLHLANRALCDLLFCFVLRLNSASHILGMEKCPREKVFIKNNMFSQKLLSESQLFCIPSNLFFLPLFQDLVILQKIQCLQESLEPYSNDLSFMEVSHSYS